MAAETRCLPAFINILIWIPFILFVVPGALILQFYKTCFEYVVTNFLKPHFRAPQMMDMLMCQGSSAQRPNNNAAQVWVVQGPWISAKEFSDHFHKCFLLENSEKYRNLYAHVVNYGTYSFYSHCKPQELDLSWHIREYNLSEFGHGNLESWAVTWMTTNTYEVGRPVWQIAILHLGSLESGTMETGIVAKFSHSLIDGYSFVHMVGKLADNPAPYIVPGRTFSWTDKLKYIYHAPYTVLAQYGNQAFSRDSQIPYRKLLQSVQSKSESQPPWLMSFTTLDLSTVKLIRKATDTHFICIMMAAQCGALRRLLLETMSESDFPENLWVASSLAWPNHPLSLTNHWFFQVWVRMADPLQRLRAVEKFYRDYKDNETDTEGMFTLIALIATLPTWARRFFLQNDFALTNLSLFFASLLLSSRKHFLLGRPVKNLYLPLACPDVGPISLYGVTTSHSGQIDLSMSGVQSVVVKNQEELDRLTQVYFTQELEAIADQCGLSLTVPKLTKMG